MLVVQIAAWSCWQGGHYNSKGREQAGKDWDWRLLPITAHWQVSKSWREGGGRDWARPVELLGAGLGGGPLRKPSILGKSEIGISDPFRRKRMWLRAALGHTNAHMQSGCLRIKPSTQQGIINELWVWQTLTLGCRGLDVLSSVTGEGMTGGLEPRRLPGLPPCSAGFSSQ